MRIKVIIGTSLRAKVAELKSGRGLIELAPGGTLSDLFRQLNLEPVEVRSVLINRRPVRADQTLREGDRVGIFPADCGGINEITFYYHQPLREAGPGHP